MEKIQWQLGRVKAITLETPSVKTFTLQLPDWRPHLPGQHYDLRLTAEDGYQAERSYSVASPPEQTGEIDLTIELVDDGEVSAYLHEGVAVGDMLEVRGPIGGYFVWRKELQNQPLLLVAGGSGVVPLMAMLRHRTLIGATNPTVLLFSVRTPTDAIYRVELERLAQLDSQFILLFTFTRQAPTTWQGYTRRIDQVMLAEAVAQLPASPQVFVCGPTLLVEQVANILVDLGLPASVIHTERFGPTGQS